MKSNKKTFVLFEAGLAILAVAVGVVMLWGKNDRELDRIAVIVQASDDSQWTAFRYGLKMAAIDEGLELYVVNTSSIVSMKEEKELIEHEIANGADAVVVKPVFEEETEAMLKKIESRIPVMLVESSASADRETSLLPVVQADNYAMGAAAATELLKDYEGSLEGKTLAIVSQDSISEAFLDRKKGLLDTLNDTGVTILQTEPQMLEEGNVKAEIIVALDNAGLITAGKCSAANDLHGALVYGIGKSTEAVYYLDIGAVECLIIPDEFAMGYQSIVEISKCLNNPFYQMQSSIVPHMVMRRDDLFLEENQEILFMMSQ